MNADLIGPQTRWNTSRFRLLLPAAVLVCALVCLVVIVLLYLAMSAPESKPVYQDYDPWFAPPDEKRIILPIPPQKAPPRPPE